jgi:hypothetical protein
MAVSAKAGAMLAAVKAKAAAMRRVRFDMVGLLALVRGARLRLIAYSQRIAVWMHR